MCFHVNYAKTLRKNILKEHIQTCASVWASFLKNILFLKVCFASTKNANFQYIGGIYLITVPYIIKGFGICERNMLLVDQIST